MPSNHLEDLVAEWYQFKGYFVRRNVQVGPRPQGGYQCELDIVAFHPSEGHLIQIEPSLDTHSWAKREQRYARKFEAGRKYIPGLFAGLCTLETPIEQVALLVYASRATRSALGGGTIQLLPDFMNEIREVLRLRPVNTAAVPEQFPLLRSLQFAANYWK
jgi:hypothetical protein